MGGRQPGERKRKRDAKRQTSLFVGPLPSDDQLTTHNTRHHNTSVDQLA